jgi:hypothetical protein
MTRKREIHWVDLAEGESVGVFPLEETASGDYICPKCGQTTHYWEGQIDQDRMGNDIDGWSFDCWTCGIGSEVIEGRYSGDND